MATDPVCGMTVDESSALSASVDGRRHYFCCRHCREKFLAAAGGASPLPMAPQAIQFRPRAPRRPNPPDTKPVSPYFCPMCPQVAAEAPGDCPVCGMALERNPAWIAPSAGTYRCPRHPGAPQAQPGTCAVCGDPLAADATSSGDTEVAAEIRSLSRRLAAAAVLTLPILALAMAPMVVGAHAGSWMDGVASRWAQALLSTPVVVWIGGPFFRRGWRSIAARRFNMWTLVSLGVGSAWLFSLAALAAPGWFPGDPAGHGRPPIYFEAAAVILVLVVAGQLMETRARLRTGDALRALMELSPPSARRMEADGDVEIPLAQVRVGDRLRVRAGDKIPVDGIVVEGRSAVDESLITGESMPLEKGPGDRLTGGSGNGLGTLVMRAERVGADTLLARIVALVAEARRSRAPIQGVADRAAAIFVPAVVVAAVSAFTAWLWLGPEPRLAHALIAAVSVLIIACPCALGLATPMSIMVGMGRGARDGILFRNAEALERLAGVTVLVVDKTGTLTEGRPRLTAVLAGSEADETALLRLAAAAEQGSEHPMAAAILDAAKARGVAPPRAETFHSTPGGGVFARVEGRAVLVGSAAFLRAAGVDAVSLAGFDARTAYLQSKGATVVLAAVDGVATGLLAAADRIRPTTPKALDELRALGVRVVMATGDQPATAAAVAAELSVKDVEAGLDPAGKAALVARLRAGGERVAMAGDGVNDAPALAAADAGLAMGTGSDAALASAGITLVHGDLRAAARAVRLSRAVSRNLRQNLAFAFLYNALGVPVAAGVLYPWFGITLNPMMAGAAMSLSSVSVIANALRLRRVRLGGETPAEGAVRGR